MINWLKKHHILHDWDKWGEVVPIYDGFEFVYEKRLVAGMKPLAWYQERYCKICNKSCRKIIKRVQKI